MSLQDTMNALGKSARAAAHTLSLASAQQKNQALTAAAAAIGRRVADIVAANEIDMQAGAEKGLSKAMLDRLLLTPDRIEAMAAGVASVAELDDPVGKELETTERPNGLRIRRVAVPLGVIGIIYESRPNVTADAAALCLKAGNAAILRGGSDSFHSSGVILECMQEGLRGADLPAQAVQRVPTVDREAVGMLLKMSEYVDVIVPRGGKGLIERVQTEARVPVFSHLDGINHTYVDAQADLGMAEQIVVNAKMRRTGICGAMETMLVHQDVAQQFLPRAVLALKSAGCEDIRGDEATRALVNDVSAATAEDWDTEYLDSVLSVRIVRDLDQAINHVNTHGSHHTEAIITNDTSAATRFQREVDAAIVMHNASTQFADGGEFGMGAEIGIATGRMHARGPVGAAQLTSYKYVVEGTGQVRP
uniref:Gamma-glutamyl phosphate reductase n=1 Tax=uncultured alpha proteobacterium HF0010_30A23 TaxID=710802 RepID=E0XRK0_9PROT|nr:gamma-glutamyl phosphate reductase [uncultured alpha proteobacterium HF0010_30A23]